MKGKIMKHIQYGHVDVKGEDGKRYYIAVNSPRHIEWLKSQIKYAKNQPHNPLNNSSTAWIRGEEVEFEVVNKSGAYITTP